jgi:hypothetical protein
LQAGIRRSLVECDFLQGNHTFTARFRIFVSAGQRRRNANFVRPSLGTLLAMSGRRLSTRPLADMPERSCRNRDESEPMRDV